MFFINLNNFRNIYENDKYNIIISSLSKFIKTFFKELDNEKLFFQLKGNHDFKEEEEITYLIFSALNEVTFIDTDLINKIGLDKLFQKYENRTLEIINEYSEYSLFYNKANNILKQQLTKPFLFKHNSKEIINVFNNDISNHSNNFINFFNNLEGNEVIDPRLNRNNSEHINKEDYFNMLRNKYFNDLMISVDRSITDSGERYKIKVFNENREVIDTFAISFDYETIYISNKEIFNKLKEELNDIYSTTYKLESDEKLISSLNVLGENKEKNKETLRYIYSSINEGKVSKLEINETTPIQEEIKDILEEHFSDIIDLSFNKPQQKNQENTTTQKPQ